MSRKVVNARLSKSTSQPISEGSSGVAPSRVLVGIDENGLGPLLGPLVVTAVRARATEKGEALARKPARGKLASRLGDSKGLVAYGESALSEAWARALLRRGGRERTRPHDTFAALALRDETWLRELCPSHHHDLCFRDEGTFLSSDADVDACTRDLDRLAARGIEIVEAKVVVICNRRINADGARGVSRFAIDLFAMEDLFLDAVASAGEPVVATAGKVGGFDFYGPRFSKLGTRPFRAIEEGKAESRYAFDDLGEIAFVRDADASNMLVGLASLVGKWVRDRLTSHVVEHLRAHDPSLPDASGYHDPVTRRLVESSKQLSAKHRIEDACFLREPAKKEPAGDAPKGRVDPRAVRSLFS